MAEIITAPEQAEMVQKILYSTVSPFPATSTRTESAKRIADLLTEGPVSFWYEPATDKLVPDWESSDSAIWITELFAPDEPEFILEITDTILRDEEYMGMYFADHPEMLKYKEVGKNE